MKLQWKQVLYAQITMLCWRYINLNLMERATNMHFCSVQNIILMFCTELKTLIRQRTTECYKYCTSFSPQVQQIQLYRNILWFNQIIIWGNDCKDASAFYQRVSHIKAYDSWFHILLKDVSLSTLRYLLYFSQYPWLSFVLASLLSFLNTFPVNDDATRSEIGDGQVHAVQDALNISHGEKEPCTDWSLLQAFRAKVFEQGEESIKCDYDIVCIGLDQIIHLENPSHDNCNNPWKEIADFIIGNDISLKLSMMNINSISTPITRA